LTGYVSRALIQELACRFTRQEHGHWSINPAEEIRRIRRGYRNGTLVLETEADLVRATGKTTTTNLRKTLSPHATKSCPPKTREIGGSKITAFLFLLILTSL